jgi:transcriptional regulator with XRE-family HTH domain
MNNMSVTVARNLKRICADGDISTRALAARVGIGQKSVWNLLNNQHSPTLKTLEPVCEALGVSHAAVVTPDIDMRLINTGRVTRLIGQFSKMTPAQRVMLEMFIDQMAEG